jgi:hypothetical protein
MQDRTILAIVAIICVTLIQIVAWYLGFNGQITTFVTSAITAILGFFTGINLSESVRKN